MAYVTTDVQTVAYKTQDMIRDTGANQVSELATQVDTLDKLAIYNQTNRAVRNQINVAYDQNLKFQQNTDLLAQLNESWNTNQYLASNIKSEETRVKKLDDMARREVYLFRHRILYSEYMASYYKMMTNILVLSMYTTLLLLIPAAMWRANKLGLVQLYVIDGIILALFLLILLYTFSRFATRSNDVWKIRQWSPSQTMLDQMKNDQQSCGVSADDASASASA